MINPINQPAASKSSIWLWLVLLLTVALTVWTAFTSDESQDSNAVELADPSNSQDRSKPMFLSNNQAKLAGNESVVPVPDAQISGLIPWQQLKRNADDVQPKNLFSVHSWEVFTPAPKLRKVRPPPPTAPPAPFIYMGKFEDDAKGTLFFLLGENKVYSVAAGSNINPSWRLDNEDESGLRLTFLPLNLPQRISKNKSAPVEPAMANVPDMNL